MPRLLRVGAGGEPGVGGGPEVAVDLLPVDHPFVAFAQGARLQRGEIRARVGFGVAEGESHLTADDPWEPLELLFVGPEAHNRRPDRADAEAVEDVGHVPVVELLVEEEGEEPALALPSVLLGPAHGCVAAAFIASRNFCASGPRAPSLGPPALASLASPSGRAARNSCTRAGVRCLAMKARSSLRNCSKSSS